MNTSLSLSLSLSSLGILVNKATGPARGQPSASTGADKERTAPSDWLWLSTRTASPVAVVGETGDRRLLVVDVNGNADTLTHEESRAVVDYRRAVNAARYLADARRLELEAGTMLARARAAMNGVLSGSVG